MRGDNGVGPHTAEAVGTLRLPGVRTLICQQLSPEHSAPVSQAHTVIFVDAAVGAAAGGVQWRELSPGHSSQLLAHAADPCTLLALARDVFGRAPAAWWLTIPAVNLDFGEELSPAAAAGLAEALRRIKAMAEQFCPADGKNCEAVATLVKPVAGRKPILYV